MKRREAIKKGAAALVGVGSVVSAVDAIPDEVDALCVVVKCNTNISEKQEYQIRKCLGQLLQLPIIVHGPGIDSIKLMRRSDVEERP